MLQYVYHVHMDVVQGAISLPAGSTAFSAPPSFPGQYLPLCTDLHCRRDLLGLGHALVLPTHTCRQDLSLKNNRGIIQLLKGLGDKNITPRVLPPPHLPTCTKYVQREQFYSSFSFVLWTFVCKMPPDTKPDHLFCLCLCGHHLALGGACAGEPGYSPSAGMARGHQ